MTTFFDTYQASIHHDGSPRYVKLPHPGEPQLGDVVTLRLRVAPRVPIERVLLRLTPDGEQMFLEMHSQPLDPRAACRWWEVKLRLDMPLTSYRFLLFTPGCDTPSGAWWYNGTGLQRSIPTDAHDFRLLAGYAAPSWVRSSVFYQIFPDRFADGDPANNVRDGEWSAAGTPTQARLWHESPATGGLQGMLEFFGGDLQGVEARLDYLQDLGVNALYINPVFTAYSNHRYDVADYFHVDPHLGGETALASLRQATARRGLRYILDIVPNHCGVMHPWFQAALADPQAETADFFTFQQHPDEYASWLGVRSLPKLNYRSQALRDVMYRSPQSVFRYWLRPPYASDGWRLDVANMLARQGADQLGMEIGRGIRQAVKEENPDAYLLGENFFDASPQLQGDMWDGVMNYLGFAKPLWYWLTHFHVRQHAQPRLLTDETLWPTSALAQSWDTFRASIPWAIACQQLNLLGSHDTARILTLLGDDMARNRLAVGMLMTYVGVPSIYYGDEIGMTGDGLQARAPMVWEPQGWDADLRQFYQTLIHLRRTSPALLRGGFQTLLVEEDTLAYLRDADEEALVVIAQRGPAVRPGAALDVQQAAIPDGAELVEIFSGQRARVENGFMPLPDLAPGITIWRTV